MDPLDPDAELPAVELAITRHEATGDRIGTLVMNPGGPGASGLQNVWSLRSALPLPLQRAFDVVSWDPRGVGESIPIIRCSDTDPGDDDFIEACTSATGPLSAHLAAPYSVDDMESIRHALGDDLLDFVGYSYGSILGAMYAATYPGTVGAFVLDGATDPLVGTAAGPFEEGFPAFAADGRPAARARFIELCDATPRCLGNADTATALDEVSRSVAGLSTDLFAGSPDVVSSADWEQFFESVLGYAGDWELSATAFGDAIDGDGSALAALIAGDPTLAPDAPAADVDNFTAANFMIYCADFAELITDWTFCDALPDNELRLEPVSSVDVERPIVVLGTEHDPLTPGLNAPEFSAALGDAVHMIWDGVGHTVFPGWTRCIDDPVVDHLLGGSAPVDGTRCGFLEGLDGDAALGDELFGHQEWDSEGWVSSALTSRGIAADAAPCLARAIVTAEPGDDRATSHVILDVRSEAAETAQTAADEAC
jgi:pimeloyl-ACP methyl ester carboxylesterase